MKKPKQCPECLGNTLILKVFNGVRLHCYKLSNGRLGRELFYEDNTNGINQEIHCVNCKKLVYDLCGWGKESRFVQVRAPT